MNQSNNSNSIPSFLEFCVLIMVKNLPGPTFNELLKYSDSYGLNKTEVKAGLVPLIKSQSIVPWSIYHAYSTFPFTGFMITEKGKSISSLSEAESKNIMMEVTDSLFTIFRKKSRRHKNKIRKLLEDIYASEFNKKPLLRNMKRYSDKFKNALFAAEIYSKIARQKLSSKNYSETASYYGSSAICYLRLKDKEKAKKYYFLAGKYFKEARNVYSALDCFQGAINFSKDVEEKQYLINQLPLPKEIIAKINPKNFKEDYWKADEELESFTERLLKITPTRTGGFLATLTNRFEEYFEEAINLNDGGKLMITSRIFYHMIEAFKVLIPISNLPEFDDYEISEKLEMSHKVGGFYYHAGEFFEEGYLPSKNVKDVLLETYEIIGSAVVRPFVFIFDGMVTGGKNYDIGTKYELLAWKNSDLAKYLQKNINLVSWQFNY